MAVTIGSVTEGNANAEEIKNNSPDSELYENNKKYLQGSLVKFNDKIYLAKRNVPSDVDLDNPYYWEIFMDAADSKRVDELFEKTGNLDELETESKDNLVNAINEAVLYTAQSLTEEEQAQARANIGAQDLYNGLTPVSYSCTDGTYSVSDTVYLESGNIISPTDTVSNDVRLAFRFINLWGIPTKLDYWKNDIKKYKLLIDNGYLENNTIWYSKPDKKHKKQIRFGTNSTLGNYIIFNFNYNYEVTGQLIYYVDTDTISTGTDTYLNRILKRDINNVLSYSAIKLSSDPTEPMQIATKHYVDNAPIKQASATELGGVKADPATADDIQPVRIDNSGKLVTAAAGGTDISLGLTSAAVGQIIKVKAIDESGKPTEWEAADMPSGGGGVEIDISRQPDLILEVSEQVVSLSISEINGEPIDTTEMVVLWEHPGGAHYVPNYFRFNNEVKNSPVTDTAIANFNLPANVCPSNTTAAAILCRVKKINNGTYWYEFSGLQQNVGTIVGVYQPVYGAPYRNNLIGETSIKEFYVYQASNIQEGCKVSVWVK